MNRDDSLNLIRDRKQTWDIIVIGGGATGAGCALDAASRGFSVLLLEQHDFGKGTSSRSTKLIHGGVRYLKQGNISLVREALRERSILLNNAPHVVHKQTFVIPCYSLWQKIFYGVGMKIYDALAGGHDIGRSKILSRTEVISHLPSIRSNGLAGGVLYYDGQFDDTRLLIDILRTAVEHGASVLNFSRVDHLVKNESGKISGVEFTDLESGETHIANAKCVINATGAFCDAVRRLSDEKAENIVAFAQGIHLVLDRSFMPSDDAIMIPKTNDGRVLFCIPWHNHVLVGTTDTPVATAELEPKALDKEIEFVLETAGKYLSKKPKREDILSVFAGIRPLIGNGNGKTSALSRGHDLFVDDAGLITITGGKWTTYRRMAEDAIDKAIEIGQLPSARCVTEKLEILLPANYIDPGERLHPDLPYSKADVIRAVRDEMARTVEDVLARRTRALFLNAKAAIDAAPKVAAIMAEERGHPDEWIDKEIRDFERTATAYLVGPPG